MHRFKWFLKNLWARLTDQRREPIDGLMAWELLPFEFDVDWFAEPDESLRRFKRGRFVWCHSRECAVRRFPKPLASFSDESDNAFPVSEEDFGAPRAGSTNAT